MANSIKSEQEIAREEVSMAMAMVGIRALGEAEEKREVGRNVTDGDLVRAIYGAMREQSYRDQALSAAAIKEPTMLKDMKDPGDGKAGTMQLDEGVYYFSRKVAVMTENIEELARQVEDLKKRIK